MQREPYFAQRLHLPHPFLLCTHITRSLCTSWWTHYIKQPNKLIYSGGSRIHRGGGANPHQHTILLKFPKKTALNWNDLDPEIRYLSSDPPALRSANDLLSFVNSLRIQFFTLRCPNMSSASTEYIFFQNKEHVSNSFQSCKSSTVRYMRQSKVSSFFGQFPHTTKLRQGNVFTSMCHSVHREGALYTSIHHRPN